MAHGSKKWITDHTGKIKRSNNRTKLDWKGDMKWWDCFRPRWKSKKYKKCPQCAHVAKSVQHGRSDWQEQHDKIWTEWVKRSGSTATWYSLYNPRTGEHTINQWYKFYETHPNYPGAKWLNNWRSYVCWKCERKEELKESLWRKSMHGNRANFPVKAQRREARALNKNLMRQERYDEFVPYNRRPWLD